MKKEFAKKDNTIVCNIEEAVKYLEECRNKGLNIYIEFQSTGKKYRLYSCDTTILTAYLEIVGISREEHKMNLERVLSAKSIEEQDKIAVSVIERQRRNKNIPYEELYEAYINSYKQTATKVDGSKFHTIKEAVEYLEECRNNGINVYLDFNSVKGIQRFYSCDITIEKAYQQIFGMSKSEVEYIRQLVLETDSEEEIENIIRKHSEKNKTLNLKIKK
ncbi:MAG: hypothetical protein IKJ43_01610 [Bacilli bacterium]|nr:hypothetical protein [Bacilli bacterium]